MLGLWTMRLACRERTQCFVGLLGIHFRRINSLGSQVRHKLPFELPAARNHGESEEHGFGPRRYLGKNDIAEIRQMLRKILGILLPNPGYCRNPPKKSFRYGGVARGAQARIEIVAIILAAKHAAPSSVERSQVVTAHEKTENRQFADPYPLRPPPHMG